MKKNLFLLIFFMSILKIFPIERNIGVGTYIQQGLYNGYDYQYFPLITLTYGDYYLQGLEIGRKNTFDFFEYTPYIQYDTTRAMDSKKLADKYKELNDREAPLFIGNKIKKKIGSVDYNLDIFYDFTSESGGISIGSSKVFRPIKALFIILNLKISYYNKSYARYFYGISKEESLKNNLELHNPEAGLEINISLDTLLFFSEKQGILFRTSYRNIEKDWVTDLLNGRDYLNASLLYIYRF